MFAMKLSRGSFLSHVVMIQDCQNSYVVSLRNVLEFFFNVNKDSVVKWSYLLLSGVTDCSESGTERATAEDCSFRGKLETTKVC